MDTLSKLMGALSGEIEYLTRTIGTGSILMLGPPRGGKGTQSKRLAVMLGGVTESSGDLFRTAALDPEIKSQLDGGDLVDSEAFFQLILPQFGKPEYTGKLLILDAVGRKKGEEQETMRVMSELNHPSKVVVRIIVGDEETRRRGREGEAVRADDGAEEHEHRLDEFHEHTDPVIKYYENLGLLITVNGEQDEGGVTWDIIRLLYQYFVTRG